MCRDRVGDGGEGKGCTLANIIDKMVTHCMVDYHSPKSPSDRPDQMVEMEIKLKR